MDMNNNAFNANNQENPLLMLTPYENAIHDIKTPMTIIYSNIQLLENNKDVPDTAKGYIEVIKNNWCKAMKLINDVNDTAKLYNGYLSPKFSNANIVDVVKNLTEATKSFADRKDIKLNFHSEFSDKIMAIDKSMIERIMLNLLSNAIKFTGKGGSVEVLLKEKEKSIQLIVKDNGQGITKSDAERMFDRYNTSDSKRGNGIGLSIVKELTKLLNGSIIVKSTKDTGTEMIIEFPVFVLEDNHIDLKLYDDFYLDNMVQIELSDDYY